MYSTLVNMGQDFYTKIPLIDPHGNVGNIQGDGAAAPRYVEMRTSKYTDKMLEDFTKESVDWMDNYDNTETMPVVLPVAYPNILLNGTYGIGQGFLSSIPSHNFKDIAERTIKLINNPDIDIDDLIGDLMPDYPTGGIIINKKDLAMIYKTGNDPEKLKANGVKDGKPIPIRIRGKVEVEDGNLVIKSIPYMKNTGAILNNIQKAVKEEKITGISTIKDSTNHNGINIKLIIKRGYDPKTVENQLYKYTGLQDSISTQFLLTTPDRIHFKYYNLKEMLQEWIDFRKVSLMRLFNSKITDLKKKIHINEALLIATVPKNTDIIIKDIRSSKSSDDAINLIMKDMKFSNIQARYVVELGLIRLGKYNIDKLKDTISKQKEEVEGYIEYFKNPKKLNQYIIDKLEEGVKLFNTERITEGVDIDLSNSYEATVENTAHTILLTAEGFIKKIDGSKIKTQNKNGQGINIGKIKENDYVISTLNVNNLDELLFFTNQGRLISSKVYNIASSNLQSYGILMDTIINLKKDEKVVYTMVNTKDNTSSDNSFLLFATKKGLIKKSPFVLYSSIPKSGFCAIDLNKDDELVGVKYCKFDMDVVVSTEKGDTIRYSTLSVPSTKRMTKGVKSIMLAEDDIVVSFDTFENDTDTLLIVTNKGNGKRLNMNTLSISDRTKKTKPLTKLSAGEKVVSTFFVNEEDEVTIVGSKKVVKIPVNQVPILLKVAACKKIISLGRGEKVLVVSK